MCILSMKREEIVCASVPVSSVCVCEREKERVTGLYLCVSEWEEGGKRELDVCICVCVCERESQYEINNLTFQTRFCITNRKQHREIIKVCCYLLINHGPDFKCASIWLTKFAWLSTFSKRIRKWFKFETSLKHNFCKKNSKNFETKFKFYVRSWSWHKCLKNIGLSI